MANDWFASFTDLTEAQLMDACTGWLERPDAHKWPTKFDLRETLKAFTKVKRYEACAACDHTGWRELVRIGPKDSDRVRMVAPCDCSKGHHFSHPPPKKPTDPDLPPPDPYDVVAAAWRRRGFTVLVANEDEPHFWLDDIDTSEATKARLALAKEHTVEALGALLANAWRMDR